MRIPGIALRTPVTITPAKTNEGDGVISGVPVTVRAAVDFKTASRNDQTGGSLYLWAVVRIRPTVKVGAPGRAPEVGDQITVAGRTRTIGEVRPMVGAGRSVAYLELVAGDG